MTEKVPTPDRGANGLPLCSQAGCALFDGKRCEALGFRPDRFCEPILLETRHALLSLANSYDVDPDQPPLKVGVSILDAAAARLRKSNDVADDLRQEIVALRMAKLVAITAAQDMVQEAGREKLELLYLRGQNTRLLSLLRACPFGHANGQVNTHRSTTTAELVSWVDEVHTEARRPADEADGSPSLDGQVRVGGGEPPAAAAQRIAHLEEQNETLRANITGLMLRGVYLEQDEIQALRAWFLKNTTPALWSTMPSDASNSLRHKLNLL